MATRDSYRQSTYLSPFIRDRSRNNLMGSLCGYDEYLTPTSLPTRVASKVWYGTYQRTIDWNTGRSYRAMRDQNKVRRKLGLGLFDSGSPFWSERVSMTRPKITVDGHNVKYFSTTRKGLGDLYPDVYSMQAARDLFTTCLKDCDNQGMSYTDMWVYGSAGIAACLPGVPPVSLFQLLGELREGAPKIPGSTFVDWSLFKQTLRRDPKRIKSIFAKSSPVRKGTGNIGSEYLNIMFGIMPSARSVVDLVNLANNYDSIKERIDAEGRVNIRRSRTVLRDKNTVTTVTKSLPWPQLSPLQQLGTVVKEETTERHVWVDCAFNHLPASLALNRMLMNLRASLPLGLVPDAASLWELVPFSWLVDYFTSAGSVFKNLSYLGVNGVGLSYAYVMCETTVTTRWTWTGLYKTDDGLGGTGGFLSTQVERVRTTKQRQKASPFGFGFKPGSLTPAQLAILAALGISRSKLP